MDQNVLIWTKMDQKWTRRYTLDQNRAKWTITYYLGKVYSLLVHFCSISAKVYLLVHFWSIFGQFGSFSHIYLLSEIESMEPESFSTTSTLFELKYMLIIQVFLNSVTCDFELNGLIHCQIRKLHVLDWKIDEKRFITILKLPRL